MTVRFKMNFGGNDPMFGEDTAFGIMPFVKIPTGTALSNNHTEGGLILMYGWDFTEGWDLGFMLELDAGYHETDDDTSLDIGIRVGLNRAAEDFGAFSGFTWRY